MMFERDWTTSGNSSKYFTLTDEQEDLCTHFRNQQTCTYDDNLNY